MHSKRNLLLAAVQAMSALQQDSNKTIITSFEVKHPIITGTPQCQTILAQHIFESSYGQPFKGKFIPKCADFNQVIATFESQVSGHQYDRYGALWVGGVELWRFTTQEPSGNTSITTWKAQKDVSKYLNLFRNEHDVVLSLDNIVNSNYTGIFNVTVHLGFYSKEILQQDVADVIVPLSASTTDYGWYSLPVNNKPLYRTIPIVPNNTVKAFVEVFMSGHGKDEFWYTNFPSGMEDVDPNGGGPFKEVQLWINEQLVGLDWPFPTIYTGGMNPLLWRPIVAINAFDVPSMLFDITPFLSLLFQKEVKIGFNITNEALPFWLVGGNLLLHLDHGKNAQEAFNGTLNYVKIKSVDPVFSIVGDVNSTLYVKTTLKNQFSASGTVHHSRGSTKTNIDKTVNYYNFNEISDSGNSQKIDQNTEIFSSTLEMETGVGKSTRLLLNTFRYPLAIKTVFYKNDSGFQTDVSIDHGLYISKQVQPIPGRPISIERLANQQIAKGYFGTIRRGTAQHNQTYSYLSPSQCYNRIVHANHSKIIRDVIGC